MKFHYLLLYKAIKWAQSIRSGQDEQVGNDWARNETLMRHQSCWKPGVLKCLKI